MLVATLSACTGLPRRHDEAGPATPAPTEPDPAPSTPVDQVPQPAKVISFEDDDDRAYRRFVEAHRPEATP